MVPGHYVSPEAPVVSVLGLVLLAPAVTSIGLSLNHSSQPWVTLLQGTHKRKRELPACEI